MENNIQNIAGRIDHTNLKPDSTLQDIQKLCNEAREHNFKMVAIHSAQVKVCHSLLQGSGVHVGAAIGFPLGQTTIETKVFETKDAIDNGADEIDYVINIGKLKDKDYEYIEDEMNQIISICRKHNVISKVIFENCYLSKNEIIKLCEIALHVKPNFIKTSTGFGPSGATIEDVTLMKSIVQDMVEIKAAGGIRDWQTYQAMVKAGATRIGTSSGIKILEEAKVA